MLVKLWVLRKEPRILGPHTDPRIAPRWKRLIETLENFEGSQRRGCRALLPGWNLKVARFVEIDQLVWKQWGNNEANPQSDGPGKTLILLLHACVPGMVCFPSGWPGARQIWPTEEDESAVGVGTSTMQEQYVWTTSAIPSVDLKVNVLTPFQPATDSSPTKVPLQCTVQGFMGSRSYVEVLIPSPSECDYWK